MAEKKYWKGLADKNNDPGLEVQKWQEFPEKLPSNDELENNLDKVKAPRRDFLKMMGFSVTAAAVAASCEIDVRKSIPYVIKPDEIIPGVPNYYASTIMDAGSYASVLVKTREGRPIKIEGNQLSKVTYGGTDAAGQASVLNLYSGNRLQGPVAKGEKSTWEALDADITKQLAAIAAKGGQIRILSNTVLSPSFASVVKDFSEKYGNVKHVSYDPISYSGLADAYAQYTGKRALPGYDFEKADKVVVGIGADFLGSWLSPLEYSYGYAQNRKVDPKNPKLSRHVQIEANMTLSGANADKRIVVKPSQEDLAVLHLYNAVAGKVGADKISGVTALEAATMESIATVADQLASAKGHSLVVSGSNNEGTQVVALAINYLLGNFGTTISSDRHNLMYKGNDAAFEGLVKEMEAGSVDALFIVNANPAYNSVYADRIPGALKKVGLTVAISGTMDETASLCGYTAPDHHYLEMWNDAQPKTGAFSIAQPTISPLFKTRNAGDSFLKWADNKTEYYDYIRAYWEANIYPAQSEFSSFNVLWDHTVHDGVFEIAPVAAATETLEGEEEATSSTPNIIAAGNKAKQAAKGGEGVEVLLYQKSIMKDGTYANNPFLQETPDPISKVTWDNYAAVSKRFAEENGLENTLLHSSADAEKYLEVDVLKVTVNGKSINVPAVIQPGTAQNTLAIAVGYGRTMKTREGDMVVGVDAYPLTDTTNGFNNKFATGVTFEKTGETYLIAQTQHHFSLDDGLNERNIVKETTLGEYKRDRKAGNHDRDKVLKQLQTLYGYHDSLDTGHHWGMAIDLNSCFGCGACVVACNVENNVPVVGKLEVSRSREMHWLRIDRYYAGDDIDNPSSIFQPLMCQHCDNAPCENVCPVSATNHSDEGLNQMAYNRCIGTRYCANNCPYKVRRFNWFDYTDGDSFQGAIANEHDPYMLTEDLTRMVLNPDVTVRSRGVMEKCSFCAQRIQAGKLTAKKAGRRLNDGDIKTACQSACHVGAISFGDLNNPESEVAKAAFNERAFKVIEEVHTLPSVTYMVKVRNRDENEV